MRRRSALLAWVFAGLALGACTGREFGRPSRGELRLGVTTKEEILRRYGDPYGTGRALMNGEALETAAYASSGSTGARAVEFVFWNGRLVGHTFISSSSDFPQHKARQVKAGMTKAQVLELMGEPNGVAVFPVIAQPGAEGLLYQYELEVLLDAAGNVTQVSFATA